MHHKVTVPVARTLAHRLGAADNNHALVQQEVTPESQQATCVPQLSAQHCCEQLVPQQ